MKMPFNDEMGARRFFEFTSLNQFIEVFNLVSDTLRTPSDFKRVTVDLGADARSQNILYREVFFTFYAHDSRKIPWEVVIEGLAEGRKECWDRFGVELQFIADIARHMEARDGLLTVERAYSSRQKAGIIAIGLDSAERGNPASRHKMGFDRARDLGFHLVAHAGEDVGPESVWDAIKSLKVERIDHGVRSVDDPTLVKYLVDLQTPLTVCPISNVALKIYPNMKLHPVKRLLDAGVFVTINSDDPAMFKANLVENFLRVADTFDLTAAEIQRLARNAFEASFLDGAAKRRFLDKFDAEASELRRALHLS